MIQDAIAKAVAGRDLSEVEMAGVMERIADGRATPAQIGALLVGLRMKGETAAEIAGAAKVLRARSRAVLPGEVEFGRDLIDTCGTGGDGARTFNVSTAAAFVAAGAGLRVAKHGNRAVSSSCGSADVLEALGVELELAPARAAECIERIGIGFLFAPLWHPAMGRVAGPRREIGLRTIFNLLGPLANPAGAAIQVLGVYRPDLTETLAAVLARLGARSAFVVHGLDGLDEISIASPTKITRLQAGRLETFILTPEEAGLKRGRLEDIAGGDAVQNATLIREVLQGRKGAVRDVVLLNAAAALVAAGRAKTFAEGVELAAEAIDSGRAQAKLDELIALGWEPGATPENEAA